MQVSRFFVVATVLVGLAAAGGIGYALANSDSAPAQPANAIGITTPSQGSVESSRLDWTTPQELVDSSPIIVEATYTGNQRVVQDVAPAGAPEITELIRTFKVELILRDDTIAAPNAVLTRGSSVAVHRTIQERVPGPGDQVATNSDTAPALTTGTTYILFLFYGKGPDGSGILGPAGEPGIAALANGRLTFIASEAYYNDIAEQGLGNGIPTAFDGVTLDSLTTFIESDNATRAAAETTSTPAGQ